MRFARSLYKVHRGPRSHLSSPNLPKYWEGGQEVQFAPSISLSAGRPERGKTLKNNEFRIGIDDLRLSGPPWAPKAPKGTQSAQNGSSRGKVLDFSKSQG